MYACSAGVRVTMKISSNPSLSMRRALQLLFPRHSSFVPAIHGLGILLCV